VVDEISKKGGRAVAVQANVAKKPEAERLFTEAEKAFGNIDVVVNNAGVYEFVLLEEVTEQQFHRMFRYKRTRNITRHPGGAEAFQS
jgi:3-oxoacyl-[acyl-carrier protein] reductase